MNSRRPVIPWRALCLILLILAVAGSAGAGTGLAFLKTGGDARATSFGEAVTSHVADVSACFWNPAGLSHAVNPQLLLSHVESFADLRNEYVAAVQPLGKVWAGMFFTGQWTDDISGYDLTAQPTGKFGYAAYATGIALALPVGSGLRVGGSWKYLNESIAEYSATGWAADLGVQWASREDAPLRLGLVVRNLGPSMSFISASFDLPLTWQGGASLEIPLSRMQGSALLSAEIRDVKDEGAMFLGGVEYLYNDLLSIGMGYQGGRDTRDLSVGLGAQQGRLALHWAFVPISEDLGDEHRFTVRLDL